MLTVSLEASHHRVEAATVQDDDLASPYAVFGCLVPWEVLRRQRRIFRSMFGPLQKNGRIRRVLMKIYMRFIVTIYL